MHCYVAPKGGVSSKEPLISMGSSLRKHDHTRDSFSNNWGLVVSNAANMRVSPNAPAALGPFDRPLENPLETIMKSGFGHDFTRVRAHTETPAMLHRGLNDSREAWATPASNMVDEAADTEVGETVKTDISETEGAEVTETEETETTETASGTGTVIRANFPRVPARDIWYFDGESPPNYTVSVNLSTNRSGGAFNWNTSPHLTLSSPSDPMPTMTAAAPSNAMRDAWVRVRHTDTAGALTAASYRLTVFAPDSLNHLNDVDSASATWGYESRIHYSILDQFGNVLPRNVPINEQWTSGITADFAGMNWRRGAEGAATVGPANWNDHIQGENAAYAAVPAPVAPGNAQAAVPVYHWDGDWRIGSLTIGDGRRVSSVTWQKNRGFARHT